MSQPSATAACNPRIDARDDDGFASRMLDTTRRIFQCPSGSLSEPSESSQSIMSDTSVTLKLSMGE